MRYPNSWIFKVERLIFWGKIFQKPKIFKIRIKIWNFCTCNLSYSSKYFRGYWNSQIFINARGTKNHEKRYFRTRYNDWQSYYIFALITVWISSSPRPVPHGLIPAMLTLNTNFKHNYPCRFPPKLAARREHRYWRISWANTAILARSLFGQFIITWLIPSDFVMGRDFGIILSIRGLSLRAMRVSSREIWFYSVAS